MVPKSKIENRAIGTLRNVIDDHPTMLHNFNTMDKEMSWDGYITISINNDKEIGKGNYDDNVSVQIKGHIDENEKYINKNRIKYQVDLEDLKVYFRDRGVLYFQIFMSNDKREIFYTSLFPSKIKTYLEMAKKKGNSKSINIPFTKIEKDPEKFYIIVKQYSNESRKQGFGVGQIVQKTIMRKDIEKVGSITASAVGVKDKYEFLKRLSSGDVCMYGTVEGGSFQIPIEWQDGSTYVFREKFYKSININNTVYYNEYEVESTSSEDYILIFSKNFNMNLKKCKFNFNAKTGIKELWRDSEFLLHLFKSLSFEIGGIVFSFREFDISKDFEARLKFYVELGKTLKMIEFNFYKSFDKVSDQTISQFNQLISVKNGMSNGLFNWQIEDKYMPVIVERHDNDELSELTNAIYTRGLQALESDDEGNYFSIR